MALGDKSLRLMVEHWLAPDPGKSVRVTEFKHRRSAQKCFVRVEASRFEVPVAMFFFRHSDGSWRIFPPNQERPSMAIP
jgi:hypothetical protein